MPPVKFEEPYCGGGQTRSLTVASRNAFGAHQRQPASLARSSAHPRSGRYWQCRPVSGRDRAAALNAGSNSGSGAYAAGTKTSMAGNRP